MTQFKTANGLTIDMLDNGEVDCWALDGTKFRGWTTRFVSNGETILYSQIDTECGDVREVEDRRALQSFLAKSGDALLSED